MNGRQSGRQHQAEDYASPSLPNGCQALFRRPNIAAVPPFLEKAAMTEHRLVAFRGKVEPAWIDYNGHLNVGYYVVAFDKGTDGLLDHLGLGEAYRRATNHSMYVLEAHVTYERELKLGAAFTIETQLIDADEKRIHFFHRMHHAEDGFLAATNELLALHVDLAGPRAAVLPADALARLEPLVAAHRRLPAPPQLGRRIAIRRRAR
jgi:acyl-CoA thioester hydrolase